MAVGTFLCQSILDVAESNMYELRPIINLYKKYATVINMRTTTANRMTRIMARE